MRTQAIVLAAALAMAPLAVRAADLVVWWEKGYNPEEDKAVREIVAAFEQDTGKEVELDQPSQNGIEAEALAAIEAGQPPDFLFGTTTDFYYGQWAYEDRLVDLSGEIQPFASLFDPDALAADTLFDATTGRRALYALPMGFSTNHVHVWKSVLEQAGFTLKDIPTEWEPFWGFWCDQVQPAVRRVTGRDDIWSLGLNLSGKFDTEEQLRQFRDAYGADYVTRDGRLVIDDPEVRRKLIKAIDAYTAIYRKGCAPPDSVTWDGFGNNKAFLAQTVVMTVNQSLSIPNALKRERAADYYKNTATIEWPRGPGGNAFPIEGRIHAAAVFKDGANVETAKEFVRFLVGEGWLGHYLNFSGERMLPAMPKLLDAPFWLDPSDPHHMAAVMQIASRPMQYNYATVSGDWRYNILQTEHVWGNAVHRIAAEGITPEQAVDEAVARIKQILSE